jgi:hypothetical protein
MSHGVCDEEAGKSQIVTAKQTDGEGWHFSAAQESTSFA